MADFFNALGQIANGLQPLVEMYDQNRMQEQMAHNFAVAPQWASQYYSAINNQQNNDLQRKMLMRQEAERKQKQSALAQLAKNMGEAGTTDIGSALLQLGQVDPETYLPLLVKQKTGSDLPSALQIANEMQLQSEIMNDPSRPKAERMKALERYNLIGQTAKTYGFDRGFQYDLGGMTPPIAPSGTGSSMGGQNIPSNVDALSNFGIQPIDNPDMMPRQPTSAPIAPALTTMADIGQPPLVTVPPTVMPSAPAVKSITGFDEALAAREALKKRQETQAQKDVELAMNPNIAGAEQKAKLEQELALGPNIEAAKTTAKSDATYKAEGAQKLPVQQRALQSLIVQSESMAPKIQSIKERANGLTTGFTGAISSAIPGTPAYDLKADVDTLLANAGFDKLQEMRDNSPTGGALGSVTEKELGLLQAAAQNLQTSQSKEQFIKNLDTFTKQREKSLINIQKAYEQDYKRFGGQMDQNLPSPSFENPYSAPTAIDASEYFK